MQITKILYYFVSNLNLSKMLKLIVKVFSFFLIGIMVVLFSVFSTSCVKASPLTNLAYKVNDVYYIKDHVVNVHNKALFKSAGTLFYNSKYRMFEYS